MKHSIAELLDIVYRYYPRGDMPDDIYQETEEHRRLVAARLQAHVDRGPWSALIQRLEEPFPEYGRIDYSLHLPTGKYDAGYCGEPVLPEAPGEHGHTIRILISFLVPYYIIYSTRTVEDVERNPLPDKAKVLTFFHRDTAYIVPDRWWTRLLGKAVEALIRIGELRPGAPVASAWSRDKEKQICPSSGARLASISRRRSRLTRTGWPRRSRLRGDMIACRRRSGT